MKTSLNSYYCTWNGKRQPSTVGGKEVRKYISDSINTGLATLSQYKVFCQYGELNIDSFMNGEDTLKGELFNNNNSFAISANTSQQAMNEAQTRYNALGLVGRHYVKFNGEVIGQITN